MRTTTPDAVATGHRCSVEGCDERRSAKGFCGKHYARWKRNGDPSIAKWEIRESCSVDGCDGKHRSRGYCESHYRRFMRHGDPLARTIGKSETARAMEAVLASDTDDCLIWQYGSNNRGYRSYRRTAAHVYVCQIVHGEKPSEAHQVRHLCGVRACVNPKHLRWGTAKENAADRKTHGTERYGEKAPKAKLTESQVREILSRSSESSSTLAKEYGVTKNSIKNIRSRKTWKWIRE